MRHCCDKEDEVNALKKSHAKVLWIVLAINLVMFAVEMISGLISNSTALLADSLDMLGDSLVYGFSLLVLNRSTKWQAKASFLKGAIMLAFGIGVIGEAIYKFAHPLMPAAEIMGWIGALALLMNTGCFLLLWRHRDDNINMQSTWFCSRNDLIANAGVLVAAGLTFVTVSKWPDLLTGLAIAVVFLRSASFVLKDAVAAHNAGSSN